MGEECVFCVFLGEGGGHRLGWGHKQEKLFQKRPRFCTKKVGGSQKGDSLVAAFTRPFCGFMSSTRGPWGLKEEETVPHVIL